MVLVLVLVLVAISVFVVEPACVVVLVDVSLSSLPEPKPSMSPPSVVAVVVVAAAVVAVAVVISSLHTSHDLRQRELTSSPYDECTQKLFTARKVHVITAPSELLRPAFSMSKQPHVAHENGQLNETPTPWVWSKPGACVPSCTKAKC